MKLINRAQEDKTTLILLSIVCFLSGLIVGFALSPIKKGITIGSNNIGTDGCFDEFEDDDDDDK